MKSYFLIRVFHRMAFLAFPWLKMNKKNYAALILAVEFKSEEKSNFSYILAIFRMAITFFSENMPL